MVEHLEAQSSYLPGTCVFAVVMLDRFSRMELPNMPSEKLKDCDTATRELIFDVGLELYYGYVKSKSRPVAAGYSVLSKVASLSFRFESSSRSFETGLSAH